MYWIIAITSLKMKVLVKCKNIKMEDIKNIEYKNDKILIHLENKILNYIVKPKLGTYVIISEDGVDYFQMEGTHEQDK